MDVLGFNRGCRSLAIRAMGLYPVSSTNFIGSDPPPIDRSGYNSLHPMGQFDDFNFTDVSPDIGNEFSAPTTPATPPLSDAVFNEFDYSTYGNLGGDWNAAGNPGDISPQIGSSGLDSLTARDTYADLGNTGQDSVGMTVQNTTSSGFSNFLSSVLKTGTGVGVQVGLASVLGTPQKKSGQNAASPKINLNVVPKAPTAGIQNGFLLPNALQVNNQASLASVSKLPAGVSPNMLTLGLLAVGAFLLLRK